MNDEEKLREAVGHIRSAARLLDEVADHVEGVTLETVVEAVRANRDAKAKAAERLPRTRAPAPDRVPHPEGTRVVVGKFNGKPLFREVIQALSNKFRQGPMTLRTRDVGEVLWGFYPYAGMKWSSMTQYATAYLTWMVGRGYVTKVRKGVWRWTPADKRDLPLRPGETMTEDDWSDLRKGNLVK